MDNEVDGRNPAVAESETSQAKHCSACPDAKATSFCVDCQEYLCTDCTNYHQRLGALRKHTLLTGENFPSGDAPKGQDDMTGVLEECHEHPKQEIQFYCRNHDALCCASCNVLYHELCTKTYIHDIAEDFKIGSELKKLNDDIHDCDKLIENGTMYVEECLKAVETLNAGEIEKLRQYKANIIEYLDRREQELRNEMQQYHDQDVAILQELPGKLKTCHSVLNNMRDKLKSNENNATKLFVLAKRTSGQMIRLQTTLQEVTQKIGYRKYSVVTDIRMKAILQDMSGFADVELSEDISEAKLKQQTSIQLDQQKIQDMVLVSPDQLLMSINEQKMLILVDSGSGQVLSEIALQNTPRLLCMAEPHLAATTLENKTIQFTQVNANKLMGYTTLNVDVDVFGIAAHNNNLVVTYEPPGVKIISKVGKAIHTLDNTTVGRKRFQNPRWISITSDDSIFVTDWGTSEITRLDSNLVILQTFSGNMLKIPRGLLTLNRDQLLLCSMNNNRILLLRPSTNIMTVILEKQHGIERPQSVCFCKEQKKLYVFSDSDGSVLVYQML